MATSGYKYIKIYKNSKGQKPTKARVDVNKLLKLRNIRLVIRASAILERQMQINYRKVNGVTKDYTICPMSYRYRKLKQGVRKVLFAHDVKDNALKMFVTRNIKKAQATLKKYVSIKYPIEID